MKAEMWKSSWRLAQVWLLVLPLFLVAQEPDDWEVRYAERAGALAAADTRGHYALARWCEQCRRPEEAARHYRMVLAAEPGHARARQSLEAMGLPLQEGPSPSATGGASIPTAPGQYDLTLAGHRVRRTGADAARYTLRIPREAAQGRPLPLVLVFSFAKSSGDPNVVLSEWTGFPGYVVAAMDSTEWYPGFAVGLAEALLEACNVDRSSILITDWRSGHDVAYAVGRRPDLFRYGFSDSTWGGSPLPEIPSPTPEQRALLRDVHVHMKLTGEGYMPHDRGYDDADEAAVHAYWEALGVRDVVIERYPKAADPSAPCNDICIGGANTGAREWFTRKLLEDGARRTLLEECERRAAAVPEGDVRALVRFGTWCEEHGLMEKAIETYRKVLELEPGRTQIRDSLERLAGGAEGDNPRE